MRTGVFLRSIAAAALCAVFLSAPVSAERMPVGVAGTWRIRRVLPTTNVGCWSTEQARSLVGTTLVYSSDSLRWSGGAVSLMGVVTREVTAAQFFKENSGSTGGVDFTQLGIRGPRVLEIDLQHEDADITGASTEVPGDSVLVASPNCIIVSACGVFLEATRGTAGISAVSARR